jgi:hypothetical protein
MRPVQSSHRALKNTFEMPEFEQKKGHSAKVGEFTVQNVVIAHKTMGEPQHKHKEAKIYAKRRRASKRIEKRPF